MSEPKTRRIPKPIWFAVAAVLMMVLWVFLQMWLPYHREQAYNREQAALGEILRLGGRRYVRYTVHTFGPEWIRDKIGDLWERHSNRIVSVDFSHSDITDKELKSLCEKHFSGLNSPKHLDLRNTQVTEVGVKELQKSLPDCYIIH